MWSVAQVTGTELFFTPQYAHFFLPKAPTTSLSWSLQPRHSPQTTTSVRALERAAVPCRAARSERSAVRAFERFGSDRPPIGACCIAGTRRVHCPIFCVNEEFYVLAGGSICSTAKCNGRCSLQAVRPYSRDKLMDNSKDIGYLVPRKTSSVFRFAWSKHVPPPLSKFITSWYRFKVVT